MEGEVIGHAARKTGAEVRSREVLREDESERRRRKKKKKKERKRRKESFLGLRAIA